MTELPCYASVVRYSDHSLIRDAVREVIDAGFDTIKLHEIETGAVRAARNEVGTEVAIALDVNCPWTLAEARAVADDLKTIDLKWLEEPLWQPENFSGLAELRQSSGLPLAAVENVHIHDGLRALTRGESRGFYSTEPGEDGRRQ